MQTDGQTSRQAGKDRSTHTHHCSTVYSLAHRPWNDNDFASTERVTETKLNLPNWTKGDTAENIKPSVYIYASTRYLGSCFSIG